MGGTVADIGGIKAQLQTVGATVQDLSAIKSQVESLSSTASQIGGIKSQVEAVGGAIQDLGAIKSQVEAVGSAVQDLGAIKSHVEALGATATDVGGIKSQVESMSAALQDLGAIKSQVEALSATTDTLGTIKGNLETLQLQESQLSDSVRAIEHRLIGSREAGAAGENLLAEAFAAFPPNWIDRDFRVGGKVVEFALLLPNQKRLPIDSKWPAADLLQQLGDETDAEKRVLLISQIEAAVASKAQEAAKYIDPSRTIHLAIAAIPDSAYSVCRKAHFQAMNSHVLVVSYSMSLPVILALYKFQLEYASSIDQERLDSHLRQIADCLVAIESEFENRLTRGSAMIANAYTECMAKIGQIKSSLSALRTPATADKLSSESEQRQITATD